MKRIIICIMVLTGIPAFSDTYPPKGWLTDIRETIEQAEKEDKNLLMYFAGSDWCHWCMKLENEVFGTAEFKQWSEDNLVKVFLDFPQKIDQTEELKRQNQILQQYFGIKGYPTVLLFNSDLRPLLQTGYKAGGAKEYNRHLEEDRNLEIESPEEFQKHFKKIIAQYITPLSP